MSERWTTYYDQHREARLAKAKAYYKRNCARLLAMREAARSVPRPPMIAHCNEWHIIDALPWQCPHCDFTLAYEDLP